MSSVSLDTFARRAVKTVVLPAGVLSRRRPGDLVILLYHRVGPSGEEIEMPAATFERQLSALAEREEVRSLDEALEGSSGGGVVVTFDDGYRDFSEQVLPMLVRYRVPALLYLATGLVANGSSSIVPNDRALTWSQLREAVESGLVTVGAHTHNHVDLSRATEAEADEEMRRSKELVEDRLGVACRHFAYPWAVGSAAADRAARRNFETAALGAWRTNRRDGIDRYRLGRVPILKSDGLFFFRAKCRGLLDAEAAAYRMARRGPWRER